MSDESSKPTRRELLAGTVGVATAVWLAACDDTTPSATDAGTDAGPDEPDAGPPECNTVDWEMTNRHPPGFQHSIDVPIEHVTAGVEQTYDITGESPHPHTVVVTPAHFEQIAAGERVTITSSEDMGVDLHTHDVILFCGA